MRRFAIRLLRALVMSRFIPIETVLAVSSIVLAVGMVVSWSFGYSTPEFDTLPWVIIAGWIFLTGAVHLAGLSVKRDGWRYKARKFGTFVTTLNFLFLATLRFNVTGPWAPGWFPWVVASLTSATAYLSLVLERLLAVEEAEQDRAVVDALRRE